MTWNRQSLFLIVLNQGSGKGDKNEAQDLIASTLNAAQQNHEFVCVEDPARLSEYAKKAAERVVKENGVLVVAGGDGTINALSREALRTQCPFGVIPQGTFNYFARAHGIPEDTEAATQALLRAQIVPAQVGLLNDDLFIVNASVGLYPQLLEDREEYKQRYGRSRIIALWSALVTLFKEHRPLALELKHEAGTQRLRTPTVVIDNNRLQLQQLGVDPRDLDAGNLLAIALDESNPFRLLHLMYRAARAKLNEEPSVKTFAFHELHIRPARRFGRKKLKTALDGEVRWHPAPLVFRVAEKKLQLLIAEHEPDEVETSS